MDNVSLMAKAAAVLAGLYGLISITGGLIGFLRASSVPSLVAGGAAGVLLLAAAVVVFFRPTWGLIAAAVICLALLGRFLPAMIKGLNDEHTLKWWTAVIMSGGGVVVLIASVIAFFTQSRGS